MMSQKGADFEFRGGGKHRWGIIPHCCYKSVYSGCSIYSACSVE